MKITNLRLRNLNSLAGEWQFDFTHPDYLSAGLFVITGPTGVGKTTILDAICLALYGATPRLDKISQSSNEIMSRGTGECLAEVIFETPSGRFRCQWSQHRSRQKADGKLQAARHEIVDDQSGRVMESHLSKTQAEVEKITGMNFEQFTRSIMLAQGAFAAFLEAAPSERAELLEQITGTHIYSEISMQAQQRESREKSVYKELEGRLGELNLDEGHAEKLKQEKSGLDEAARKLDRQLADKDSLLKKLEKKAELLARAAQLSSREKELKKEAEALSLHQNRLARHRKAQLLSAEQAVLERQRKESSRTEDDLAKKKTLRIALSDRLGLARKLEKEREEALARARAEEEKTRPVLTRARALDAELGEKERHLNPLKAKLLEAEQGLGRKINFQVEKVKWPLNPQPGRGRLAITGAAAEHCPDWGGDSAALRKRLDDIRARRDHLKSGFEQIRAELDKSLAGLSPAAWREKSLEAERHGLAVRQLLAKVKNAADIKKETEESESAAAEARRRLKDNNEKGLLANELLRSLEKEQLRLSSELLEQKRIQSLAEHRQDLTEGRPCPLCGALEHPWADPSLIPADCSQKEKDLTENRRRCEEARQKAISFAAEKSRLEQALKSLLEAGEKLTKHSEKLGLEMKDQLQALALPPDCLTDALKMEKVSIKADENARAAAENLLKTERLENDFKAHKEKLEKAVRITEEAERLYAEVSALSEEYKIRAAEHLGTLRAREALLPGREADAEEKRLAEQTRSAEEAYDKARKATETIFREQEANEAGIKDAEARLLRLNGEIAQLASDFLEKLQKAGFEDEKSWAEAVLPESEYRRLEASERSWAENTAAVAEAVKDNQSRLAAVNAELPPDLDLEALKEELAAIEAERRSLDQRRGALDQQLLEQSRLLEKHRLLLLEIEKQKAEKKRWENLSKLIGSHDGQRYRNFAQGLSFEIVVRQANRQLAALSDRYLLTCDRRQPLELNVLDNYQGGEERSTRNLSGGERFIVSLALALGLSQMASRRVRVDSLFLDEGFGTLDEDSLETVLETLSGLRESGKLIGLISHIPALTDRIPVQIRLRPLAGARSAVSGPGVSSLP